MPAERRGAPPNSMTDQERAYVQARDPGAVLLKDIEAALDGLHYDRGASEALLGDLRNVRTYHGVTPPFSNYELPSDIEEVITLRSARFEVQLYAGLHETGDEGYIALVLLVVPLMGWEAMRLDEELVEEGKGPDWSRGWTDGDIESFQTETDDAWSAGRPSARGLVPVLARAVDDPFEEDSYVKRREAMIKAIQVLCTRFPFKVHFTESGNIPKEVSDEWIAPGVLEEFKRRLSLVEERLAKAPHDPALLLEKASLMMGRDALKDAEALLDEAVKLEPNLPFIWFALADVYARTDREDDADRAEARGAELERLLDGRWPARPDILDYTPPLKRFSEEAIEDELKRTQARCSYCGSNFLLVSDGFWAQCNQCNRAGPLSGLGLKLSLKVENETPTEGEPIIAKVIIENPTSLEMTYSTDDLEFISMPPPNEVTDDGEDDSCGDLISDWIGKLKAPYATGVIPPHGTKELSIDLRQLEVLEPTEAGDEEQVDGVLDCPGEHRVSVYLKVTVGPIEDGREPWDETDPVRVVIKGKR